MMFVGRTFWENERSGMQQRNLVYSESWNPPLSIIGMEEKNTSKLEDAFHIGSQTRQRSSQQGPEVYGKRRDPIVLQTMQ